MNLWIFKEFLNEKFKKDNSVSVLSDRELDALKLIAGDLSNQEIADKLFVSLNTA